MIYVIPLAWQAKDLLLGWSLPLCTLKRISYLYTIEE